jgi:hypothetical protein
VNNANGGVNSHISGVKDAACGVNLRCTFETCTVREHKGNYGVKEGVLCVNDIACGVKVWHWLIGVL